MTEIILVDRNDNVLGHQERGVDKDGEIHRVAGLWLTNSKDEILIAQRSFNKNDAPGEWGPAVGGTVERDETYESNIVKETKEELGFGLEDYRLGPKLLLGRPAGKRRMCQIFMAECDRQACDFQIQQDEVEAVRWITAEELKKEVAENPANFTSVMFYMTGQTGLLDYEIKEVSRQSDPDL